MRALRFDPSVPPPRSWSELHPQRSAHGTCALVLGALGVLGPNVSAVAPDSSAQTQQEQFELRDCQRTLRARQALLQDEALTNFNLGVSVRSGVATLWGLVPTKPLADRAVARVRLVAGILDVRNEVHVVPPGDPLTDFLARPQPNRQRPSEFVLPAPRSPGALTSRPETKPATDASLPVMPSIAIPPRPGTGTSQSTAVIGKPELGEPPQKLIVVVDRLRQRDARFRWIHPEVQGGIVRLRGAVHHRQDLFDFAQAVSRLPGVERVIVEDVQVIPAK